MSLKNPAVYFTELAHYCSVNVGQKHYKLNWFTDVDLTNCAEGMHLTQEQNVWRIIHGHFMATWL
jgi:hypothetical protein